MHRAQVYEDVSGLWRYRVLAMNGEPVGASESYTRRWSAVRAVKKNTDATTIEVYGRSGRLVRTITR